MGALHGLLPDHWLPYVLLAKARRWDLSRSIGATVAGGVAHLASTAALGLVLAFLGAEAAPAVGPAAELAGAGILAVFGLALSLRAVRARHPSPSPRTEPRPLSASGDRSHLVQGVLLGLRPCAEAMALFLAAAAYGLTSSVLAVIAWVASTLGTMLAAVWLSLRGLRDFRPQFLERWGELVAGLVILLMGLGAALLTLRA